MAGTFDIAAVEAIFGHGASRLAIRTVVPEKSERFETYSPWTDSQHLGYIIANV